MINEKVRSHHLERKAILYVRQSSAHQVLHNRESSTLQYAMRDRLTELGWSEIEVIDDDLGRSAAGGVQRAGFERMVAEVCLGSWAIVRSPLTAASATFALKAGVWFRRGRLFMVSPDSRAYRARRQAETPLSVLFKFASPALKAIQLHPMLDDFWKSKQPDLEEVDVPTYVVASWTDHGIHTRGTLEGFRRISSRDKYLEVHGQKKWARYYWDESVARQLAFFDRYLKGEHNEVDNWPKVRIEVRDGFRTGTWRDETEWPLARTEYTKRYLDAASKTANGALPAQETVLAYPAQDTEIHSMFTHTFARETELTGYAKLKLWISTDGSDDADIFVAVQKLDTRGEVVNFPYFTLQNDGQTTHGWLRVSHRELDKHRSTPQQPFHLHQREQRMSPGEIVDVEIELWPSSTLFRAGDSLRVLVKGTDIQSYPPGTFVAGHNSDRNKGTHRLHTSGRFDSHLLIPVTPTER